MDVVETVYRVTGSFPGHEAYGLTNQMRRAAVSVPSNIAEGHARVHTKEYLHHLSTAAGSLAELDTQVEIAARLGYIAPEDLRPVVQQLDSLGRQLRSLRTAVARRETGG
jgi:four helix bundle protein